MSKPQVLEDPSGRIYYRWQDCFHEALGTVILLMVVFFMFCAVFWLSFHYAKPIQGSSMQPLINNYDTGATGDIAIVSNKLRYTYDDIIIIDMERSNTTDTFVSEKLLIKRVIALPGDTILLENLGSEYVFMIKKQGESTFHTITSSAEIQTMTSADKAAAFYNQTGWTHKITKNTDGSITLPDGYFFFVGDNRNASYDCRNFGPVEMSACVGVVEQILPKDSFLNKLFGIINWFNTRPTEAICDKADY